jgi:hypothetical protein
MHPPARPAARLKEREENSFAKMKVETADLRAAAASAN